MAAAGISEEEEQDCSLATGSEKVQRDYIVDLWPYSRPSQFYYRLLRLGRTSLFVLLLCLPFPRGPKAEQPPLRERYDCARPSA